MNADRAQNMSEVENLTKRIRTSTEKGKAFRIKFKSQSCNTVKNRIRRVQNRIEALMDDVDNVHTVQRNMETFNRTLAEFQSCYIEWSILLDGEDKVLAME